MQQWMDIALAEARAAAAEGEVPVGAVIVKDGILIAQAHNQREQLQDPTEHAEIACLRKAAASLHSWRMQGCTMYVTLEPCPMCAGALVMSRISHIVFGARDAAYGCCGSVYDLPADPVFHSNCTWQSGEAAEQLLDDFFTQRRSKE